MRFIEVHPAPELANRAAARVIAILRRALQAQTMARFLLSGGSTPRKLNESLVRDFQNEIDWSRVEFFFGDERAVPPDDPGSNYRMARESLFDPMGIASERIHRIEGEVGAAEAAARYENRLRKQFGGLGGGAFPMFDLVLLGLGTDAHTASLFPGDAALSGSDRWVVPGTAPVAPHARITLTFPVLNAAAAVIFLAGGADKVDATRRTLAVSKTVAPPAAQVNPVLAPVLFMIDEPCGNPLGLESILP